MVVLLKSLVRNQSLSAGFNFVDLVETKKDNEAIQERVHNTIMNQSLFLYEHLSVLVQAAVVHQVDQERIESSNWLVRLLFFDVAHVGVD